MMFYSVGLSMLEKNPLMSDGLQVFTRHAEIMSSPPM